MGKALYFLFNYSVFYISSQTHELRMKQQTNLQETGGRKLPHEDAPAARV